MVQTSAPTFHVAVLGSDGIGPEVAAEGVKVLHTLESLLGSVHFKFEAHSVGAAEYRKTATRFRPPPSSNSVTLTPFSSAPWACRRCGGRAASK